MKRKRIKKTVVEHVYSSQQLVVSKNVKTTANYVESKPIFELKKNKHES